MTETVLAVKDDAAAPVGPASPVPDSADADVHAHGFSPSLIAVTNPTGAQAEAIRALRTHVMVQHINLGRRALAVCGPSAGVGTTFIAANLAVALSQIGVKTLLIDGNLREPGVDAMIRPRRSRPGLAQCLASSEISFIDNIDADVLPDLSVMYAGQAVANAQELLAGDRFKTIMDFCLREYDATIVDTPPANTCSDARRISSVVGYSLIVTGRNRSFVKDVKILIGQLQVDRARILGTVLNQA